MTRRQLRNLALAGAALGFAAVYGIVAWSLAGDTWTAAEEEASKGGPPQSSPHTHLWMSKAGSRWSDCVCGAPGPRDTL